MRDAKRFHHFKGRGRGRERKRRKSREREAEGGSAREEARRQSKNAGCSARARRSAAAQQASPPPGTFVEQLACIQGGFQLLSKGASMESLANFPAFQGVVRPLLSQRGSATD
ncbi:unnamed protein product [Prunus armeniaca]